MNLLARWRNGDQQAATELYQRYAERLIALTQRRVPARLAVRVDAEDVVQSVYRSFFVAARNGRYVLQRSGDLWRLLLAITLHKVQYQFKWHTAGKRSIDQEEASDGQSLHGIPAHVLAKEPSPDEAVALADLLEQAMQRCDAMDRRMIELRLQGYLLDEIAADAGCCKNTVLRVMERFKKKLEQDLSKESPEP
jgi:DNA-directed RNA polymerase specialized sigma24 family protein